MSRQEMFQLTQPLSWNEDMVPSHPYPTEIRDSYHYSSLNGHIEQLTHQSCFVKNLPLDGLDKRPERTAPIEDVRTTLMTITVHIIIHVTLTSRHHRHGTSVVLPTHSVCHTLRECRVPLGVDATFEMETLCGISATNQINR